jgi:hypothetical protein
VEHRDGLVRSRGGVRSPETGTTTSSRCRRTAAQSDKPASGDGWFGMGPPEEPCIVATMKVYVTITGILFGVLTIAHVWRMFEERPSLATDPWYILITVLSAALCLWAWRLLRIQER